MVVRHLAVSFFVTERGDSTIHNQEESMTTRQVKNSRLLYGLSAALAVTLVAGAISICLLINNNQTLTSKLETVTEERDGKQTEIEKLQKDHKLSMKAADGYVQAIDNALEFCSIVAKINDITIDCASGTTDGISQDTWEAMQKIQEEVRRARKNDQ